MVDSHTYTAGADQEALNAQVRERVAECWAAAQQEITERLATQEGQANPESATGTGAVVHALQQAQAGVRILDSDALSERTFLSLGAEPWIATAPEQTLGAPVLDEVSGPAALLRAAALTDARILLVPGPVLPKGVDVAARLRWPTGPAAPAAS